MNMSARYSQLPRWVAKRIRDVACAKMAVPFGGQARGFKPFHMDVNRGNPSINSDCGTVPSAATAGRGRFNQPVGVSALLFKTGTGKPAQPWAYVLRRKHIANFFLVGGRMVTQPNAAHSSLLRSRYSARWTVFRQVFRFKACQVGYFFFAVEVVKQSLGRFTQAFRLSLPGTPAEVLDVDNVAYGDFPFITASACEQINTQGGQGIVEDCQNSKKLRGGYV